MKKLMIAAAAAVIAGGAFAQPQIYEYKAALKNMNLKEVKVTIDKSPYYVYMKYATSTSLKGWLIMDEDGVTSPTIMTDRLALGKNKKGYGSNSTGFDYGRNRGFLVVINPKAYKAVRRPKILPAILDAKWIDTAFAKKHSALTGVAEGYLYVGGDAVKPVRPQLDWLDNRTTSTQRSITNEPPVIGAQVPYVPSLGAVVTTEEADDDATGTAGQDDQQTTSVTNYLNYSGMVAIADYVWTSIYLFAGSTEKDAYFNGPNWFSIDKDHSPFGMFEFAWDQNLPPFLQTGWMTNSATTANREYDGYTLMNYYHDTWMNGSGVAGKWSKVKEDGEWCCGIIENDSFDAPILETLSGNVKGGLFLCTENGIDATDPAYNWVWDHNAWEDQFTTARLDNSVLFNADSWQNDLWQDGFFEIETTDVITGTWIIKRATGKFFAKKNQIAVDLSSEEKALLYDYTIADIPEQVSTENYEQVKAKDPDDGDKLKLVYIDAASGEDTFAKTTEIEGSQVSNKPKMGNVKYNWTSTDTTWGAFAYDELLWSAIKGAALNLAKKNGGQVTVFDGSEIHAKVQKDRAKLPMVTPQFALYYRLVYGKYNKSEAAQ